MFNAELVSEMGKLRGFALRLTDQPSDAEDLLQASLLKAIEKQDTFRPGSNVFAWCSKIMYNTFVSAYRRRKKHESQYDPEPIIASQASPDRHFDSRWCAEVGEAMEELSPHHRSVLHGVCVEGKQYQEMARKLDIPVGTVRSRLNRARQELEKSLVGDASSDTTQQPAQLN